MNEEHVTVVRKGAANIAAWGTAHAETVIDLTGADLRGADLGGARLSRANLGGVDLGKANLFGAELIGTNLFVANLAGADLSSANLFRADLSEANLSGANLRDTGLWETVLGNVDLRNARGLETSRHGGPSILDWATISRSWPLPEVFLRGCGLPDELITFLPSLLTQNPIQYSSVFISYSSKDDDFARRLHTDLQADGVRCWFAPEDLKIGDKFRLGIDEAIRRYDKLLLILSERSVTSRWVKYEVERALNREATTSSLVLFPVRLDDVILTSTEQWAQDIRDTRHIGDFTGWKDHDVYQASFKRVLRDLKAATNLPPGSTP